MRKFGLLGTSALGSVTFIGLSVALAAPAYAQPAEPAEAQAAPTAEECAADTSLKGCSNADGTTVDEKNAIVVTGSRIKRDTFNSPSPITVLTRTDATVAGFNSTTELLQSTAVTAGARQIDNTFTGFITDGGPGANTLSLRSLGAARTLILLNGRRLAP
ncbi:MAG TPA: TonB-dependent receptor plug domain-containing protein, partial [Allosphingosinicella sp.]